ncbi:GNAT family N-acetyltransferase [Streptomyces sp. NBC_01693]|uniref:GNAT family N-acetyltransferase n=1 Tax=unclassified Streptomyces TaxID=2593676 RepID=UPI003FCE18A7
MLDSAVAWMNARGNTEQWGTVPYSRTPGGPARVEGYTTVNSPFVAELDGVPAGALVLDSGPNPRMPIPAAGEPELYVRLLVSDRRAGVDLLRVDCWAGGGGELVAYYERNGFVPTDRFLAGTWPGQVLARRVG